ncbi:hypothetical protein [Aeromicrobium sp.]|uniref:hypothetical protein n=1 Tax=Aeromicrobium sp. TaxID=1871063 RepID=UPI0035187186
MPIVDLSARHRTAARAGEDAVRSAPRRLGLSLRELQEAALRAGRAPLPFDLDGDLDAAAAAGGISERLGASPGEDDARAFRSAAARLADPVDTLERRGLLDAGHLEPGLAGALGVLATADLAVDIAVHLPGLQARAWHRRRGEAVACLATLDGLVFELAWLPVDRWAGELARVAALSPDLALRPSGVPALVDLPRELADAGAEAVRAGRSDLLPVLAQRWAGRVLGASSGEAATVPLGEAEVVRVLAALGSEARGRLRALTARTTPAAAVDRIGVVAWTLLADGWHALRAHRRRGEERVELTAVGPDDLAARLGPAVAAVLATDASGGGA